MTLPPDNASESGERLLEGGTALSVAIAIIIALLVTSAVSFMAAMCWLFLVPAVLGPVSIHGNYNDRALYEVFNVLPYLAFIILAGFFTARIDLKKAYVDDMGLNLSKTAISGFSMGLAMGLVAGVIVSLLYLATGLAVVGFSTPSNLWWYISSAVPVWVFILIGAFFSSIAYETFFRGYVQRTLTRRYNVSWSIAITTIISGMFVTGWFWLLLLEKLISGMSAAAFDVLLLYFIQEVVGIFLLFWVCGYLYYVTGSLTLSIGFNFLYSCLWDSVLNTNGILYFTWPTSFQLGFIPILVLAAILGLLLVYNRMEKERKGSVREAISGALDRMAGSSGKP